MRVIQVSELHIVSMHATGAMVFTASQGAEPKHGVALGFERCGAHVRDLLLQRIQHGAMPADDHLLTLVPRPCAVEMCEGLWRTKVCASRDAQMRRRA